MIRKYSKLRDGFTLIEVIVVVAILFILSGAMIPFVYRVWESSEIDTTKERMSDLKKAMVGDPNLIQNGVRTYYGFMGDCGQLPRAIAHPSFSGQTTISDDLPNPGTTGLYPSTCNHNYMPSGYDPNNYKKDAWGNEFVYTPYLATDGSDRRGSATLKSAGPDRQFGTLDDNINDSTDPNLQINESEAIPTAAVQGNVNFVFYATSDKSDPVYSAMIHATYIGPFSATTSTNSDCIPLNIGTINANIPKPIVQNFSKTFVVKLPIGKVLMRSRLYGTNDCSGAYIAESNEVAVFISDGLNPIFINAPTINYTIP